MRILRLLTFFSLISIASQAQMVVEQDTIYGNEWIDFDKTYWKIKLADDGVYRISFELLENLGFPINEASGQSIQLYRLGEQVALHVNNQGVLQPGDYIEFFGHKNRGELDQHLFSEFEAQLNPEFSLFSDTSVYFLTYDTGVAGLRLEDNPIGAGNFSPQNYYVHEEKTVFNNWFHKPTYSDEIRYSHFHVAEGYGTVLQQSQTLELPSRDVVETTLTTPKASIRFGSNYRNHVVEFSINNELKENETYFGFDSKEYELELEYDELKNTNVFKLEGTSSSQDRYTVAYGKLTYPKEPTLEEDYFEFIAEESPFERNFEFDISQGEYIIYDLENQHRIIGDQSVDGKLRFKLEPGQTRKIYIVDISNYNSVAGAEEKSFVDIKNVNAEFLFVTSNKLYNPEDPNNQVAAYAEYRSSIEGGAYETYILTSEDILDQFAYGIERHNIGNNNLAFYLSKHWPSLEFWFNVGKGIQYNSVRFANSSSAILQERFHVPSFGIPGSDNMMLSGKEIPDPMFNVGRIAINNETDLRDYLEKVKAHDNKDMWDQTFEEKYWMKKILHLSGGDPGIQESIFQSLENMRFEIEENKYGGDVSTFRKTSSSPIQPAEIEELLQLINTGLSVITFFGHSAVGTFDFNLQQPSEWTNQNKYPFILSLGCHSGNIHTSSEGLSEEYLIQENRGAIAFLASSGTAFVGPQAIGGQRLYQLIGTSFLNRSLSEAIRSYIKENVANSSLGYRTLMQQLTYHGDPAIKLGDFDGPDFVFDYSSTSTNPEFIDNTLDSFELKLNIANLGSVETGELKVRIQHFSEDDSLKFETTRLIEAPQFESDLRVNIPVLENPGKNIIKATVDIEEQFEERPAPTAEQNNDLVNTSNATEGYCFFTTDNSLNPVCPTDFSIWNKNEVKLFSSTNNAFDDTQRKYVMEIDTVITFDSSLAQRMEQTRNGGLVTWEPNISFDQETVYYWRVSPDSISPESGYFWKTKSFLYNPQDELGWNQSHKHQFDQDELKGIIVKDQLEFDTTGFYITIKNGLSSATTGFFFNFENNALSVRPFQFLSEGVAVAVLDGTTGTGWINSGGDFGSINTNALGSYRCFGFPTQNPEDREKVVNMIRDEVPDGDFVFLWTVTKNSGDLHFANEWSTDESIYGSSILKALEEEGALLTNVLGTSSNIPYGIMYQKGKGVLAEEIGQTFDEEITIESFIPLKDTEGSMRSTTIGPAKSWSKISVEFDEILEMDTVLVKAYGILDNGSTILLGELSESGEISLSNANESSVKNIYLEYEARDLVERDPGDLIYWKAYFEGYPDLAIGDLISFKDSLQQGEQVQYSFSIQNTSTFDIQDSFQIKYLITDAQNQEIEVIEMQQGLASGEMRTVEFRYESAELLGDYTLTILLNEDQRVLEKEDINNFALTSFNVREDETNPLLDVTFDGFHINDGDIVSPKPLIRIELKDENVFLLNEDINQFVLKLTDPNNETITLDLSDPAIQFYPQTNNESNAVLEYRPCFELEGEYLISIEAKDASGNLSGYNSWERVFNVILQKAISEALFYPNPFSTSTKLVFTVTGEVPENFYMRLYTMSGKIVREIERNEIGDLRVGINQTSFHWDGTDMFGNKLANGIYLYKVFVDDEFEKFDTGSELSQYFDEGFGKVVIMR